MRFEVGDTEGGGAHSTAVTMGAGESAYTCIRVRGEVHPHLPLTSRIVYTGMAGCRKFLATRIVWIATPSGSSLSLHRGVLHVLPSTCLLRQPCFDLKRVACRTAQFSSTPVITNAFTRITWSVCIAVFARLIMSFLIISVFREKTLLTLIKSRMCYYRKFIVELNFSRA
jgi:hypothetical protein